MIDVLLTTLTPVAAVPPKVTLAPLRKFVPVIVTAVPPDVVPEFGAIAVTFGAWIRIGVTVGQRAALAIAVGDDHVDRTCGVRRSRRRNGRAAYHRDSRGGRATQLNRRSRQKSCAGDGDRCPARGRARRRRNLTDRRRRIARGVGITVRQRAALPSLLVTTTLVAPDGMRWSGRCDRRAAYDRHSRR